MKIRFLFFTLLFFLTGCYAGNGGIPLFGNYTFLGNGNSVVVHKGETLYSIAKNNKVERKDLISANNLKSPYILKVGQRLKLPATKYHSVAKGDTLYSIARKYETDVTTLSRANHLDSPHALNVGQRLLIPSGKTSYSVATNQQTAKTKSTTAQKNTWQKTTAKTQQTTAKKTNYAQAKSTNKKAPASVSKNRKTKFAWPVRGTVVSKFGTVGKGVNNDGINIRAAKGTTVKAADSGTVAYSGNELKGYGNLILIKHSDGWITAYAHNDKLFVKKGQKVVKGEKIATVGTSGGVSTAQLHFETRAGKTAVNPLPHLQ